MSDAKALTEDERAESARALIRLQRERAAAGERSPFPADVRAGFIAGLRYPPEVSEAEVGAAARAMFDNRPRAPIGTDVAGEAVPLNAIARAALEAARKVNDE